MVGPTDDLSATGATPSVRSTDGGPQSKVPSNAESFKEKMGEGHSTANANTVAESNKAPTQESIHQQMDQTNNSLNDIHHKLAHQNIQLKPAQAKLLKGKLNAAHEHINVAAKTLGVTPRKVDTSTNPLKEFMNLTMSAQSTFSDATDKIKKMAATGGQINPADMLLLQAELNKASQNLEYSSIMISKVVEGFKTLINTQL